MSCTRSSPAVLLPSTAYVLRCQYMNASMAVHAAQGQVTQLQAQLAAAEAAPRQAGAEPAPVAAGRACMAQCSNVLEGVPGFSRPQQQTNQLHCPQLDLNSTGAMLNRQSPLKRHCMQLPPCIITHVNLHGCLPSYSLLSMSVEVYVGFAC